MRRRFSFRPDETYRDVSQIDFERLYLEGYRLILFDVDNTLVNDGAAERSVFSQAQINRAKAAGFKCMLVSNGRDKRIERLGEQHKIEAISSAGKPSRRGVIRACSVAGILPEHTVMIGDQIFTDIMAGNLAGVRTILVNPLTSREKWYIVLKRIGELPLRLLYMAKFLPMAKNRGKDERKEITGDTERKQNESS
ncbi:MAG: YqeG family HAD IIIA-type phosphatase [Clostridiaceae bacterium]|nr:YqeG family HAD IIIA-type phosphatase [Clostridiaceae bacterium]